MAVAASGAKHATGFCREEIGSLLQPGAAGDAMLELGAVTGVIQQVQFKITQYQFIVHVLPQTA